MSHLMRPEEAPFRAVPSCQAPSRSSRQPKTLACSARFSARMEKAAQTIHSSWISRIRSLPWLHRCSGPPATLWMKVCQCALACLFAYYLDFYCMEIDFWDHVAFHRGKVTAAGTRESLPSDNPGGAPVLVTPFQRCINCLSFLLIIKSLIFLSGLICPNFVTALTMTTSQCCLWSLCEYVLTVPLSNFSWVQLAPAAPGCQAQRCQLCVPSNGSISGSCCGDMQCFYDTVFEKFLCLPDQPWICGGASVTLFAGLVTSSHVSWRHLVASALSMLSALWPSCP